MHPCWSTMMVILPCDLPTRNMTSAFVPSCVHNLTYVPARGCIHAAARLHQRVACVQVYKALMDDVKEVATKFLNPVSDAAGLSIKKFAAEVDFLRACRDENIVGFVGAWLQPVSNLSTICLLLERS